MKQSQSRQIVFIVYKVGWWSCFDSIYRKHLNEENTTCFVIPVTCYEWDETGRKINYSRCCTEVGSLPADINVTSYNECNLENMHPDMIYIHNPYDECNRLETTEEKFYSSNLKLWTDELIYVPHMLYYNFLPEQMKNLPVYQNVDKIILANEEMKIFFQNIPGEKFIITEPSQVSYIKKLKNEESQIPKNWISMLENGRDFAGKRVILYHVGFTELFYGTDSAINKIKYMLDFMKTRKDIVLVLRPERDIWIKLKELPDSVSSQFEILIDCFIREKIGVLDLTEDACMAALQSDVYIGETSSMVNLFGIQGKAIILLDRECRQRVTEEERCSLRFWNCDIDGNKIWFVDVYYGLICNLDLDTEKIEVVTRVFDVGLAWPYLSLIKENDKIFALPFNEKAIYQYNLKSGQTDKIYIDSTQLKLFYHAIRYKDYLYYIPICYPGIVRYDIKNNSFKKYSEWVEEIEKRKIDNIGDEYFLSTGIITDGKLILPSAKANIIIEIDLEGETFAYREVGEKGSKFMNIEFDGHEYWLTPHFGKKITSWNSTSGKWQQYSDYMDNIDDQVDPFSAIIKKTNCLILLPELSNLWIKIEPIEKKIEEIKPKFYTEQFQSNYYDQNSVYFTWVNKEYDGNTVVFSCYDDSILLIEQNLDVIKKIKCRVPLNEIKKYYKDKFDSWINSEDSDFFIREQDGIDLSIDYACYQWTNKLVEKKYYYSKLNVHNHFENDI